MTANENGTAATANDCGTAERETDEQGYPETAGERTDRAFRCESCSSRWYYSRARCLECGSSAIETYQLDSGRVVATTTVHATPPGVRTPNRLGLVRFDDEVSLIAQLQDTEISVGESIGFGEIVALRSGDSASTGPRLTSE